MSHFLTRVEPNLAGLKSFRGWCPSTEITSQTETWPLERSPTLLALGLLIDSASQLQPMYKGMCTSILFLLSFWLNPSVFAEVDPPKLRGLSCYELLDSWLTDIRPWQISSWAEEKIQKVFADPSQSALEQVNALYDTLETARLENLNRITRALVKKSMAGGLAHLPSDRARAELAQSPAIYLPFENRVLLANSNKQRQDPADKLFDVHEREHSIHRNSTITFISLRLAGDLISLGTRWNGPIALYIRRGEARAVGSQWEVVHRIPERVRHTLMSEIDREGFISIPWDEQKAKVDAQLIADPEFFAVPAAILVSKALGGSFESGKFKERLKTWLPMAIADFLQTPWHASTWVSPNEINFLKDMARQNLGSIELEILLEFLAQQVYSPQFQSYARQLWVTGVASKLHSSALNLDRIGDLLSSFLGQPSNTYRMVTTYLFRKNLEYAHLDKKTFIQVLLKIQSYDLQHLLENYHLKWASADFQ